MDLPFPRACALAISPSRLSALYAFGRDNATGNARVFTSRDRGLHWNLTSFLSEDFPSSVAVDPTNVSTVYALAERGLYEGASPLLYFNCDKPGGMGAADIYASSLLPDGSFGPPSPVVELNSPQQDARPSLRFDGLEVVLFSSRIGTLGGFDLWAATRESILDLWSTPENLGPLINSSANDQQPHIGADRKTLYFASSRAGGLGQLDLYVATRDRVHPDANKESRPTRLD